MARVATGLELSLVHRLFVFEGLIVAVDESLEGWRKGGFAVFDRVVGSVDEEDFFAELGGITEDLFDGEALLQIDISKQNDSVDIHKCRQVSLTRR